jgi:hypothetical protein
MNTKLGKYFESLIVHGLQIRASIPKQFRDNIPEQFRARF